MPRGNLMTRLRERLAETGASLYKAWRMARTISDPHELRYLREFVLRHNCPVCQRPIDAEHALAKIGAWNSTQPPESDGYLDWVRQRRWDKITGSLVVRMTSQDVVVCDALRCPKGLNLIVWVELDELTGVSHRLVHTENIDTEELTSIESHTSLAWIPFPPMDQ